MLGDFTPNMEVRNLSKGAVFLFLTLCKPGHRSLGESVWAFVHFQVTHQNIHTGMEESPTKTYH